MAFLFKTYWLAEVTHQLIRFNKTKFSPWNKSNTERYVVNTQNTPPLREGWSWKGLVSMKISDTVPPTPSPPSHFLGQFQKLNSLGFLMVFRLLGIWVCVNYLGIHELTKSSLPSNTYLLLKSNCFDLLCYVICIQVINFVSEYMNTCFYEWRLVRKHVALISNEFFEMK